MAFGNGPRIVTDGLVLALDASDRNSYVSGSTIWTDVSGNNNSGSLINGPTFNTGSGGSIVFDGVNDYVNLGSTSTIQNLSTELTLEAFVFGPQMTNQYGGILMKTTDSSWANGFGLYYESLSVKTYVFYINVWNINRIIYNLPNNINETAPLLLTGTYSTTQGLRFYINGNLHGTVSYSTNIVNPSGINLNIGCANTAQYLYKGSIYSARVYNRALSAQEVLQNYNATKTRFGL